MTYRLPLTYIQERDQIEANLHALYRDSDKRIGGLAAYNAGRGDVFDFHESGSEGRMFFAQESGIFCNLDGRD